MSKRVFLTVDGQGDKAAAPSLLSRLWNHLALSETVAWLPARIPGVNTPDRFGRAAGVAESKRADALVILTDMDDGCPKDEAPRMAEWLRERQLPFPSAVVLLYREYETLFLPCVNLMAGRKLVDERGVQREGLRDDVRWVGTDYQKKRGVKEWLTTGFPEGRIYKETMDQVALTRMLDFSVLEASGLPCFGSLVRALRFLDSAFKEQATRGRVYPQPPA
jgi:hypothetical protein